MTSTTPQTSTKSSAGIGTKLKGGVQVAKGLGDTVRGTTMGAVDAVEHRDSSVNDEIARRGRMEIEDGIAMIKGHPVANRPKPEVGAHNATATHDGPGGSLHGINGANSNAATNTTGFAPPKGAEYAQNSTTAGAHNTHNGPGDSLQGWGSGINGAHANATANSTGFPPPKGAEYAQNSTTAGGHSDLGRSANAYSGNEQPPQYPNPNAPPPQDHKGGLPLLNPTQMGNRPTTGADGYEHGHNAVGAEGYQQRQDADRPL
ncbi:hypothetical protein C8J57DRAFT_1459439 [Mycena rebaudengoi]|nr:hypothetical protein C8J57DRAFT_1459439 [Mycena rebaudengoi]